MQKAKVGVVYTTNQSNAHQIHRLCYAMGLAVQPLMPDAASNRTNVDIVIIPDNIGLYPGLQAFSNALYQGVGTKPMDSYAELFRINALEHYVSKEIPIIGIGDGACMLWNYLGNKLAVIGDDKYAMIPAKTGYPKYISDGTFIIEFAEDNIYGVSDLYSGTLKRILNVTVKEIIDEVVAIQKGLDDDDFETVEIYV